MHLLIYVCVSERETEKDRALEANRHHTHIHPPHRRYLCCYIGIFSRKELGGLIGYRKVTNFTCMGKLKLSLGFLHGIQTQYIIPGR